MKSNTQTSTTSKTAAVKGARTASRKNASPAKRTVRAATKRAARTQSAFEGYSDSAARLIKRGKTAFGDAYTWVGETGGALPKTARHLGLPDQKSVQTFIGDKPLILGAVGLGIGVVLGAMLPSVGYSSNDAKPTSKPTRRK